MSKLIWTNYILLLKEQVFMLNTALYCEGTRKHEENHGLGSVGNKGKPFHVFGKEIGLEGTC